VTCNHLYLSQYLCLFLKVAFQYYRTLVDIREDFDASLLGEYPTVHSDRQFVLRLRKFLTFSDIADEDERNETVLDIIRLCNTLCSEPSAAVKNLFFVPSSASRLHFATNNPEVDNDGCNINDITNDFDVDVCIDLGSLRECFFVADR
jgi:hypothetical protein